MPGIARAVKPQEQARGTAAPKPVAKTRGTAPAKPQARYVSAPAPKPAAAPSGGGYSGGGGSSYDGTSGGNSSGSGGGGGVGGGNFGGATSLAMPAAPVGPVMEDLTIPDPLADPTYQRQKAELLRARSDFDAQQILAKSQYDGTFNNSMRQMGWRDQVPVSGMRARVMGKQDGEDIGGGFDPNAQGTAYGDAYQGNEGDFAGRGLFNSGEYLKSVGNLNNNFTDRRSQALSDQKNWQDTQSLNQRNFVGQQDATDLAARSDAIAAIAARLGVDINQVTPGSSNVIQREKVG